MAAKLNSNMTRLSAGDIENLALDPHNIVMPRPTESTVPLEDRMSGENIKKLAKDIFLKFRETYMAELATHTDITKPISIKTIRSNVRRSIVTANSEFADFWKAFPRVFCKLTSINTTEEQYNILVAMFDVRISEDNGYATQDMSNSVIQQLLMGKLAKDGTFADHGIVPSTQ